MELKPLEQWVCDECGKIIESPEDGYFEFLKDPKNDKLHGFRIVHHKLKSPKDECYKYTNHDGRMDNHLEYFLGASGLVRLLSFIDIGPHHCEEYKGHRLSDLREWTEIMRRLHIPYYEEARNYWQTAENNGFFDDINEVAIYLPGTLKELIEVYGN